MWLRTYAAIATAIATISSTSIAALATIATCTSHRATLWRSGKGLLE
jgi:hypothetical protein